MADFLRDLWQGKPDGMQVLIWALHGRSAFFNDPQEAQAYAETNGRTRDMYMGVALRERALPPDKRGGNEDVSAIGGLWLDVDIAHAMHQKKNLFQTEDEAEQFILHATPLAPTYIIHSGHGFQAWWFFKELWIFDTAAERKNAADLARKWTNFFRHSAHVAEREIDALHDLSRVMRIPGTMNCKDKDAIVPVKVWSESGTRFNVEDFEPYLLDSPEIEKPVGDIEAVEVGSFIIDPNANPPAEKFDLLRDTSIKFRRSWDHTRVDMTGDKSLSAYDQSLASLAARAGWTEQEICDLLIAHRRNNNESGSHKNIGDYIRRTIKRGFTGAGVERKQAQMIEELAKTDDPVEKKEILSGLFSGIHITRVVKFMSDPPTYRLETSAGTVAIPTIGDLIALNRFSLHVANATRRYLPKMKEDKWSVAAQAMLDIMEEESAGEEATDRGMVRGWLVGYLGFRAPTTSLEDAHRASAPFTDPTGTFLFSTSLRQWLYTTTGDRIDSKQLGTYLKAFGCEPTVKQFPDKEGSVSRYCWRVNTGELE